MNCLVFSDNFKILLEEKEENPQGTHSRYSLKAKATQCGSLQRPDVNRLNLSTLLRRNYKKRSRSTGKNFWVSFQNKQIAEHANAN